MRTVLSSILVASLLCSIVILASCGAKATPAPAPAAAPTAVAPTVPTSAPRPTAAPAAQAPPKTVVVEKEVKKATAQAPTVVVTTPTPGGQPISAAASAPDWDRIRAAGRIVVGMSPGYRPFAYNIEGSEIDGFDVALIREIGQRLGLEGVARDVAPNALLDALRTRQIDLALPSPGGPPVDEVEADFTKPYHVCRDVVLAAEGAAAGEVRTAADLTGQKVGVLGSSRHEVWLQRTLLDTGQMEPTSIFTFTMVSQVVSALQDGQIDLAILDKMQAQPLLKQGIVQLVGQDLNKQNRSLAVPKGFDRLRQEVDRVLAEMARDGTLARLSDQYLGIEARDLAPLLASTPEPSVTPTPSPVPTVGVPAGSFTADPIHIAPGECTHVTWNVENVREVYFYTRGERWDLSPATGQESRTVCPTATVTYELRIIHSDGVIEVRPVTILVDEQPQLPITSRLSANPASVVLLGECVTLAWEVHGDPDRVQIVRDQTVLWANAPEAGSMQDCPPQTGTVIYGVLASAPGHTTQTQRVITVNP
jgi:ABC-type amino acid transport substrate-binding protein